MSNLNFDKDTALASMLFIAKAFGGICDKYALLKTLYFADQMHLVKYGRPITGDSYVAMQYGPVPSSSFDILKYENNGKYFNLEGNRFFAVGEPNLDQLSESDIEVLNAAIEETRPLKFGQLKHRSHDDAYNQTLEEIGLNKRIPSLYMAAAGGASPTMIEYIKLISENQNCNLNGTPNR